ncbi:MAG: imidazole glycerol phosphate synthase subunit HisH [Bacteroidales bacterium]|nr:imidazole glycerol phosphate synthase subunit HisH [Bacteroidales bacterium]
MTSPEIVIVDYGMANLRSVQKACEKVGARATVTADPAQVATAARLVLPGVGAFQDAIARLRETGLADAVRQQIQSGRPFLGICLGLQLLFTRSQEEGTHTGLGILPGEVVRFPVVPGLKVPHMGWNPLTLTRPDCPLFAGLPADPAVYFVHSYYAVPEEPGITAAEADYPTPFCAMIWRENIFAAQFHPEKSQQVGLRMLENFAKL